MPTFNTAKSTYVIINNNMVANVERVEANFHRERVIENNALVKSNTTMYVKLKRLKFVNDPLYDGINIHLLDGFTLEIHSPRYKSVYTGCQVTDYSEIIEDGNVIIDEVTIASLNFSMTSK